MAPKAKKTVAPPAEPVAATKATGAAARVPQCKEAISIVAKHIRNPAAKESAAAPSPLSVFTSVVSQKGSVAPLQVVFQFALAPPPNRIPLLVKLPHAVHQSGTICLITPTPASKYTEQLLEAGEDAPKNITKIIDDTQLKAKFALPVALRGLAKSFDTFFVHSDLSEYPTLLAGEFLTWRHPIWMSHKGSLSERLNTTLSTVVVPRRGFETVSIAIGDVNALNDDQLVENVVSLIETVTSTHLTNHWRDIQAIRIEGCPQGGKLLSLPIYVHDYLEELNDPVTLIQGHVEGSKALSPRRTSSPATPRKDNAAPVVTAVPAAEGTPVKAASATPVTPAKTPVASKTSVTPAKTPAAAKTPVPSTPAAAKTPVPKTPAASKTPVVSTPAATKAAAVSTPAGSKSPVVAATPAPKTPAKTPAKTPVVSTPAPVTPASKKRAASATPGTGKKARIE